MLEVGIDSVEISRIERSIENKHFFEKVFGCSERAEFESRNMRAETIAASFACKEAFGKALGTGIVEFSLNEVELLHDGRGKPYIELSGKAEMIVESMDAKVRVSITHTQDVATAVVILFSNCQME